MNYASITKRGRSAFSLLEVLVATSVLMILVVLLSQVVRFTQQAISYNLRRLDAIGQVRLVFDRLAIDLSSSLHRDDIQMEGKKSDGDDSLRFYSAISGHNGVRGISVVGYRVHNSTADQKPQLERGIAGSDWSGGNKVVFAPNALPTIDDVDYAAIAKGIFRFEETFILNDGTSTNADNVDLKTVIAIVVTVAVVDETSRKLLSAQDIAKLASDLEDPAVGQDPLPLWKSTINRSTFGTGVARSAVQGVSVHQRTFYAP